MVERAKRQGQGKSIQKNKKKDDERKDDKMYSLDAGNNKQLTNYGSTKRST